MSGVKLIQTPPDRRAARTLLVQKTILDNTADGEHADGESVLFLQNVLWDMGLRLYDGEQHWGGGEQQAPCSPRLLDAAQACCHREIQPSTWPVNVNVNPDVRTIHPTASCFCI